MPFYTGSWMCPPALLVKIVFKIHQGFEILLYDREEVLLHTNICVWFHVSPGKILDQDRLIFPAGLPEFHQQPK